MGKHDLEKYIPRTIGHACIDYIIISLTLFKLQIKTLSATTEYEQQNYENTCWVSIIWYRGKTCLARGDSETYWLKKYHSSLHGSLNENSTNVVIYILSHRDFSFYNIQGSVIKLVYQFMQRIDRNGKKHKFSLKIVTN